jgi:hypothetical protein
MTPGPGTRRLACALLCSALPFVEIHGQRPTCPPQNWSLAQLEALKREGFKLSEPAERHELARALPACLGHPNPAVRDGIAFEALSAWMRAAQLDHTTLQAVRSDLLQMIAQPDKDGFAAPFAALVLAEVARTDRVAAWMSAPQRSEVVGAAATYLRSIKDYRAFDDKEGFRHGVAHGADLALQLVLNPATTKTDLDQLLAAVASQVSPAANVAYWAGEPDRLARPVVFAAQRKLHFDEEWRMDFTRIADPAPLTTWQAAFASESGIKKRHNVRAFLLSVYASASSSEDPGIRRLIGPVTAALKTVL